MPVDKVINAARRKKVYSFVLEWFVNRVFTTQRPFVAPGVATIQAYVQKSLFRAFVNGSFAPLTFLTRFTIILFRLILFDEQYESSQSSCLLSSVLTRCRKRVPTDFVSFSQTGHLQAIMVLPLIRIIHWGMTSINAIKS